MSPASRRICSTWRLRSRRRRGAGRSPAAACWRASSASASRRTTQRRSPGSGTASRPHSICTRCCRCRPRCWSVARTTPTQSRGLLHIGGPNACAVSRNGPGDRGGACRPGTRRSAMDFSPKARRRRPRSSASHPVGRSCASCCGRCRPTEMDIGIADPAWGAAEDTPRVALAGFEGSLALLVELARTHQIDLSQLPVADVVDQLMAALQHAGPAITLGRKGDWVVLAAWLLLLRSRLLLPVETQPDAAATETAGQLRDRLIALQAAQALAAWLDQRPQLGHDLFARGQPELLGTSTSSLYEVDVIEFLWACAAQFEDDAAPMDTATVYQPP